MSLDFTENKSLRHKKMEVEAEMDYKKWGEKLDFMDLKDNWMIKVIPAYGGATIRFLIRDKDTGKEVSVYFDTEQALGAAINYFEVYSLEEDGRPPKRVKIEEGTDELIKTIEQELEYE